MMKNTSVVYENEKGMKCANQEKKYLATSQMNVNKNVEEYIEKQTQMILRGVCR